MKIENDEYLEVKGKCTKSIVSCAETELIVEVFLVPKIDINLQVLVNIICWSWEVCVWGLDAAAL